MPTAQATAPRVSSEASIPSTHRAGAGSRRTAEAALNSPCRSTRFAEVGV